MISSSTTITVIMLFQCEDDLEATKNAVERLTRANGDLVEENRNLLSEYEQLKEMCRREVRNGFRFSHFKILSDSETCLALDRLAKLKYPLGLWILRS